MATQATNVLDFETTEMPHQPVASIRDRFAAQALDLIICALLLWYLNIALKYRYEGVSLFIGSLQLSGRRAVFSGAVFAAGAFLYYFLLDSLFGATVGKLLCRLQIQTGDGNQCGIAAALIRTLLLPVDALIGLALMATSPDNHTLGDRVAGTTVVNLLTVNKKLDRTTLNIAIPAGWETRTKAILIDLLLTISFALAYLLATGSVALRSPLSVNLPGISLLVLIELLLFYFIALEGVFGGTLGKLICRLKVVRIDGNDCGFTGSTLRALCRLVDLSTVGILPFLLVRYTRTRQHVGDRLASTVVINTEAKSRVWQWIAVAALLIGLLAAVPFFRQAPSLHAPAATSAGVSK
jgi:uncharacterized RDD family membrane protein YckC